MDCEQQIVQGRFQDEVDILWTMVSFEEKNKMPGEKIVSGSKILMKMMMFFGIFFLGQSSDSCWFMRWREKCVDAVVTQPRIKEMIW